MNGFQSLGASTGVLGLQLAELQRPDVILCDIHMPALNGFTVLNRLRENPATEKIPLIFITAKPVNNAHSFVQNMGVKGYLTKPFSTQELIELLETITTQIE